MVNIQFGQIYEEEEDDKEDMDECMVIGVFEKKSHFKENLERKVEDEDEIDLTLDLLGDGYKHIDEDKGWMKKEEDNIEDDLVDADEREDTGGVEARNIMQVKSKNFLNKYKINCQ